MKINYSYTIKMLGPALRAFWDLSSAKLDLVEAALPSMEGTPVVTQRGRYGSHGRSELTLGYHYGSALLQYEATKERRFLELARTQIQETMSSHIGRTSAHDYGMNCVCTYGNLMRLMSEGRIPQVASEWGLYSVAVKLSGSAQAARWALTEEGRGFTYSVNGAHSLFADGIRALRVFALAYRLGHELVADNGARVSLLSRLLDHAYSLSKYNVYYGEARDLYDVRGRVSPESIFAEDDGRYRGPGAQLGYSPYSTWMRGLAWIMLGYAEQLEFFDGIEESVVANYNGKKKTVSMMLRAARSACDYYIYHAALDGIPYWDTGAPSLHKLGSFLDRPAEPFNDHEPVDSSAAVLAAQGMLRLGHYLMEKGDREGGKRYYQAGLTVCGTLFSSAYMGARPEHMGLLLHAIHSRPDGRDCIPKGAKVPCGESLIFSDYHIRELALYLTKEIKGDPYFNFFFRLPSGGE